METTPLAYPASSAHQNKTQRLLNISITVIITQQYTHRGRKAKLIESNLNSNSSQRNQENPCIQLNTQEISNSEISKQNF